MKKSFVTTSLLSFLAVGCAKPAVMAPRAEAPAPPATEMVEPETAHAEPIEVALPADPFNFVKAKKGWGEPGDYVVYRFTGSYRKTPLQMTRTVVGRRGGRRGSGAHRGGRFRR